ncbi:MAG: restriction endonuclease [Rubrobacteraceae bacterium]
MTIPDYQTVMLPLLDFISDGEEHHLREAVEALADHFSLSEEERLDLLPSGRYPTFDNRVGWAGTYMKEAKLIERPRRGYMKITNRGLSVLQDHPESLDAKFLERYPEFVAFRSKSGRSVKTKQQAVETEIEKQTPVEAIEAAYQTVRNSLSAELLQQTKSCSPGFFERLVVEVLVKMGYGGTRKDAGEVLGKSGDEGIDGVINEDRLGLDVIYIQAKRWESTVSRPEIQKFVGALQGKKARKGIFITTSDFSKQARDYASSIESSVMLIDGEALSSLMIDYSVGTTVESWYEIKRVDSDYFDEA